MVIYGLTLPKDKKDGKLMINTIITGTGSYIPSRHIPNSFFLDYDFYDASGQKMTKDTADIVAKLQDITAIEARRWVEDHLRTSDIAAEAAAAALDGSDPETIDYIIVGQNLGDVPAGNVRADVVPALASRIKHKLKIKNPYTVAFDIPFGCPGWLQGMITADLFIKAGGAKKILVIGAEVLSRICDPHDVDAMIFADGAGAVLVTADHRPDVGILAHVSRSDTYEHVGLLTMGSSYNPHHEGNELYIKMQGHDIYKYALRTVPMVIRQCIEKAGLTLTDVDKVLVHQANQKMDEAILQRLFKMYNIDRIPDHIMPMTIAWLGNSSVATLPTMYDLIIREELEHHHLHSGDTVVFASVGAGMNINAMVYRLP
ncbi:MAG: ketoacyl-ACP synthase III [Desulfobacteraceae bacterium]|nr:ketoacyl-ACP synthase III [Desulfobacteraceae bacterium]